jgi:hypothetical protein
MSALTVTLGADITVLRRSMSSATQLVSASAKKMASLTAVGLKVGLGAALAGGGVALAAGMKAVTSAADFEQTKVAFTTLIGDSGKAEQTLAQLRELGAKTPFEFPELADPGHKLIAFGEGADTVAATLARIGDVSAGVQHRSTRLPNSMARPVSRRGSPPKTSTSSPAGEFRSSASWRSNSVSRIRRSRSSSKQGRQRLR